MEAGDLVVVFDVVSSFLLCLAFGVWQLRSANKARAELERRKAAGEPPETLSWFWTKPF